MNARLQPVSAALVGILLGGIACTSYKQIEIGEINQYDEVRVILTDGSKQKVFKPYSGSEKLRGFSDPVEDVSVSIVDQDTVKHYRSDAPVSNLEIPLEQITSAQHRKFDVLKSLGCVGLVTAGAVLILGVVLALDPPEIGL
jgi:hypothetical protein